MKKNIPINKGNYSLDTKEREEIFNKNRGTGCEKEFLQNRKDWEELPKNFRVPEYPLLVDLELSTVCNLKCPFCYTITDDFKKRVKPQLMDFNLYKKVIDEIGGKVFAIRLSLRGESTLHPNLVKAIKYAKLKGIKEVSFLTNGSKLTPEYFEELMKAGADWITLSFDGLYEEYEKNRNPLKFNEMYLRLKKIKEIKEKYKSVKPVIKLQTVWPAIENNPSEYYNKLVSVSDLLAFNPLIDCSESKPLDEIEYEDKFSCPMIYQRLVIGADGMIMMCSNDEKSEHIIGDANKESIYDIWHGEKLTQIRETHKKDNGFKSIEICQKCYLPRKTREDISQVNDREIIIRNYL